MSTALRDRLLFVSSRFAQVHALALATLSLGLPAMADSRFVEASTFGLGKCFLPGDLRSSQLRGLWPSPEMGEPKVLAFRRTTWSLTRMAVSAQCATHETSTTGGMVAQRAAKFKHDRLTQGSKAKGQRLPGREGGQSTVRSKPPA